MLNIRSILMFVFMFLVLISIATGLFALRSLSSLVQSGENYAQSMSRIDMLGEMARLSANLNQLVATLHYEENPDHAQVLAQRLAEDKQSFSVIFAQYSNTVVSKEERALLVELKANWQHFLAVGEEIVALDKAGQRDLAKDIVVVDLQTDGARFSGSVQNVLKQLRQLGDQNKSLAAATGQDAQTWIIVALVVQTLFCVFAGILLFVRISRPVSRITEVMRRLSANERDIVIPDTDRRDEIGAMAAALGIFRQSMIEAEQLREAHAENEAAAKQRQRAELQQLAANFEQAVGEVVAIVASASTELQASAETLSAAAEETSVQSRSVAEGARAASVGVQNVVAAIDQLSILSREVVDEMTRSREPLAAAVNQAKDTRKSMAELQSDAEKVESVLAMINQIASQTNLLALNATIEAARSGEAGRGFAVVANEVKALSGQTAQATTIVTGSIDKMRNSTSKAFEEITSIEGSVEAMNQMATSIASVVMRQTETAQNVTGTAHNVSRITGEVTANIESVAVAAGESSVAASQVLSSSAQLARQAEKLKSEVHSFLERVRAA